MTNKQGILYTGTPSPEERLNCPGRPSVERLNRGPVAVIECLQEIPCNPCEAACPFGAIKVGLPITNLPVLLENLCTGCGLCLASCPGLAIFKLDLNYSRDFALVEFPFEYYPLPEKGSEVAVVNHEGERIGEGIVETVKSPPKYDRTTIVGVLVNKQIADQVRGINRILGFR